MKTFFKIFFPLLLAALAARAESVVNTVHNLSITGPGTLKASSERNTCVFCHTVHRSTGVTPLWNHSLSTVSNYVVYSSARLSSLNLTVPQPNGSSRLCLSCHDGTVALGSVSSRTRPIDMNGVTTMPAGVNNLGTDLSADHPISFMYDAGLAGRDADIKSPSQLTGSVRLDAQNRLQCTACHDPHNNQYGNFLVMDNTGSALCLACHQTANWSGSVHALSSVAAPPAILSKIYTGKKNHRAKIGSTPIAAIGCASCHSNHRADGKKFLMEADTLEQNCLVCHSGTTAKKNIAVDFQKPSIHPILVDSAAHDPNEDPINPATRHVVCADCHNSHAATRATAIAPNAPGDLAGLTGVTAAGGVIQPLKKQYELCFRCHADSNARGPALVARQFPQTNLRLAFAAGNASFHPVAAVGKNAANVPSLISPTWTVNSVLYCTDCHNSDSSPAAGGVGANGPHGSAFAPILERNLALTDNQAESPNSYALCYKCHSRAVVLSRTSFRYHESHVVNDKAACTTCHDSHGVATAPHLMNFNTTYVTPSSIGPVKYTSLGTQHGVCTLTCHGKDHKSAAY